MVGMVDFGPVNEGFIFGSKDVCGGTSLRESRRLDIQVAIYPHE